MNKRPLLTFFNNKGGVGKTTTAINVATSIARAGRRVLLIDLDPQGNLTSGIGLRGQRAPGGPTTGRVHVTLEAFGSRLAALLARNGPASATSVRNGCAIT